MKARTKAIVGGVITCAISVMVGIRVPRLIESGQTIKTGMINANKLTDFTISTCPMWWTLPAAMLVILLIMGRGRDPDETFFKGYYGAFNMVMALMMMLLIGGLMVPMMDEVFLPDDR